MSSNSRETEHNEDLVLSDDPAMQGRIEAAKGSVPGGDIREEASPEARIAGRSLAGGLDGDGAGGTEGQEPVTEQLDRAGDAFEGSMSHDRESRQNPDYEKGTLRVPAVGNNETSGSAGRPTHRPGT